METYTFTAPGRTEIGGNHTDHQHGCVLAAAVNLETVARVTCNGTDTIRIFSEGYAPVTVELNDLAAKPEEKNTTAALVRGMAAVFAGYGARLQGFDAYVTSTVLPGSGLSSSAAFEVLMGNILNGLFYENKRTPVEVAQAAQWVENTYFGKPCGLMDQAASAVGGLVFMDFADPAHPVVERLDFDFAAAGHALCIIDTGADHADLTAEYAAIPGEMKQIAAFFWKEALRDVPKEHFYGHLSWLRGQVPDRALLRAIHFYEENERACAEAEALRTGDFAAFLQLVRQSGQSSWMYLQNVTPAGATKKQDMALALALCDRLLAGRGAFRVHGGGFAGTVQAFVPDDLVEHFRTGMEEVFGAGACHVLTIR